ncbi:MAG: Hint domain-containing protein [Janthinobacterium lividum]
MPTSFTVGSETELNAALGQIDVSGASSAPSTAYTIALAGSIALTTDLDAINLAPGSTLAIQGNGHTIDGGNAQRGLFAYAGGVTVSDLAIDDTKAAGGFGYGGGGAGAGLGGGLFVASGAQVSLDGVTFGGDSAVGGADAGGQPYEGGGGGLGGAGGPRGGGGIGLLASGGTGGPGIVLGAAPGGTDSKGGLGGSGGGGGGSGLSSGLYFPGGGGGVGGGSASPGPTSGPASGASGGFGGGGAENGNGGFGGGGGIGANGGFGGGAGFGGAPGFGGAGPYYSGRTGLDAGGAGLGAGGAIFVQQGGELSLSSGTIAGGAAQGGHDALTTGFGFGAGLFLQGNGQIALSSSAGGTLAIGDAIADQTGSTGQTGLSAAGDPLAGAGSLLVEGPGRVVLSAPSSSSTLVLGETYSGGTTLTGGTLELTLRGPLGGGDVAFDGPATLVLDVAPGYGQGAFSTIDGFAPGDTIDFRSLLGTTSPGSGSYIVQQDPANPQNVFISNSGGNIEQLDITGAHDLQLGVAADGSLTLFEAPCFARGTRIDTPGGTAAVEDLAPGDHVRLAAGGSAPVRWVGHRRVDLRRHPRPETARPVRVRAHALGPGLPRRDLVLSPEHALLLGGVLVPVRVLADGAAVAQESPERVTYFHVELDRHGVILAEGLPAESYLDTGNRDGFANGAVTSLHPDFAPGQTDAEPCAPMRLAGPEVEAARATLRCWQATQEERKRVLS